MFNRKLRLISGGFLLGCLLLTAINGKAAAAQMPVKENIDEYIAEQAGDDPAEDTDEGGDTVVSQELPDKEAAVPGTGEKKEAGLYYGLAAACLLILLVLRIKDAGKADDYR